MHHQEKNVSERNQEPTPHVTSYLRDQEQEAKEAYIQFYTCEGLASAATENKELVKDIQRER